MSQQYLLFHLDQNIQFTFLIALFVYTGCLSKVSFRELIHARGSETIVSCTSNRQDNEEGFPGNRIT